jgi:hypothetical protein
MRLLALPIQRARLKCSFPAAALAGLVLALSAFVPVVALGLSGVVPALAVLSMASVFFVFWAGTVGIPCLAIFILIELWEKRFEQAAYTSVIFILNMILVSAWVVLTPIGQFLSKQ